jgi:trimethylamine:corrinoid methyltransferase-like protein
MRAAFVRSTAQQLDAIGEYRDLVECAREKVSWILENHHPEPPSADVQREIDRILAAADREMRGEA